MNRTKISTCDFTWNPLTGCLNGCKFCYARKLAHGRLKSKYLGNRFPILGTPEAMKDPFSPRFWRNKLDEPAKIKHSSKIFVVDMGDLFGDVIPLQTQLLVFDAMAKAPWHTYQLYTKYPHNLSFHSPYPDYCWVGVSATNWVQMSDAIGYLSIIKAPVKFISFEPLLARMQFDMLQEILLPRAVDWLIIGQQTPVSKKTEPKIEWIREIVEAADKAGIPVFLKNNIRWICGEELDNKLLTPETPALFHKWGVSQYGIETMILRQEWPKENFVYNERMMMNDLRKENYTSLPTAD